MNDVGLIKNVNILVILAFWSVAYSVADIRHTLKTRNEVRELPEKRTARDE